MRTDDNLIRLIEILQVNYGDKHAAARQIGMSPMALEGWLRDDEKAREQVEEAQRLGRLQLESEAIRRGAYGVDEDVYYKGEVVGQQRKYSDSLLSKLLEAHVPQHSKKADPSITFNGPTQVNLMPRAETYEDWLNMRDATAHAMKKAEDAKKLPAPEPIVDAQYEEVFDPQRPLAALKGLGI